MSDDAAGIHTRSPGITEIAQLIPDLLVSEQVRDWPEDERDVYRNGYPDLWDDFTDRGRVLQDMRKRKVAKRILALFQAERDELVELYSVNLSAARRERDAALAKLDDIRDLAENTSDAGTFGDPVVLRYDLEDILKEDQ